jgi:hypothetical protein
MKLATVKVEYTCGLTLTDGVTLDVTTGELHLPPRLVEVMSMVGKWNARQRSASGTSAISYRCKSVQVGAKGGYDVTLPEFPH